jgi:hypothetical protein
MFAFAHELWFERVTIDKPCPPGVDPNSPGRYNNADMQELTALAELYASVSPALQTALLTPECRESFKAVVSLCFLWHIQS